MGEYVLPDIFQNGFLESTLTEEPQPERAILATDFAFSYILFHSGHKAISRLCIL
jgi:hypothetical protein